MKAVLRVITLLGVAGMLNACVMQQTSGDNLKYAKKAIDVSIACSHDCNYYAGQPHTVYLTFYELSQPNMYNRMLGSQEGIAQLVAGGEFDKTVLTHQSVVIQPGEFRQVLLDRVEGARYLSIIAGYRSGNPRTISRVYPVNLQKTITFFWRDLDKTAKMRVNMRLGREGMLRLTNTRR